MDATDPAVPGNGRLVTYRLDRLERDLGRVDREKADAKDLEGLARVVREGFDRVDKRFDAQDERSEQEAKEASTRRRQTTLVLCGFGVSILTALIGTGSFG